MKCNFCENLSEETFYEETIFVPPDEEMDKLYYNFFPILDNEEDMYFMYLPTITSIVPVCKKCAEGL